jgi:hypothetical protein
LSNGTYLLTGGSTATTIRAQASQAWIIAEWSPEERLTWPRPVAYSPLTVCRGGNHNEVPIMRYGCPRFRLCCALLLAFGVGGAPAQTGFSEAAAPGLAGLTSLFDLGDIDGSGSTTLVGFINGSLVRATDAGGWSAMPLGLTGLPANVVGVRLEDLNGDGLDDLVVWAPAAIGSTFDAYAALSLGGGAFSPFVVSPGFPFRPDPNSRMADLTGDGLLDYVIPTYIVGTGYVLAVHIGNGAGSFTAAASVPAASGIGWCDVTDVDADGDEDVVASALFSTIQVFLNDGAGTLTPLPTQTTIGEVTSKWGTGDVNGDGAPDVVLSNGSLAAWYLNDGTGRFTTSGATQLSLFSHQFGGGVLLRDLDLDGTQDMVAYSPEHGGARVCLGGFAGLIPEWPLGGDGGFAFGTAMGAGDVDGDGDTDFIASVPTRPTVVLRNILRGPHPPVGATYFAGCAGILGARLGFSGSTAAGNVLVLEVSQAPAGTSGFLVASPTGAFTRTAFGCYFGLSAADIVFPHTYASNGTFNQPVMIPPGFSGYRLCVQDLQVGPGLLGGVGGSNGLVLAF